LLTNSKDVYEKLRDDIAFIEKEDIKIETLLSDPLIDKN